MICLADFVSKGRTVKNSHGEGGTQGDSLRADLRAKTVDFNSGGKGLGKGLGIGGIDMGGGADKLRVAPLD